MKTILVSFILAGSFSARATNGTALFWLETPASEARLKDERAFVRELEDGKGLRVEVKTEVTENDLAELAKHHRLKLAVETVPDGVFDSLIEPLDLLVSGPLVQKALLLTAYRRWKKKEPHVSTLRQALALHPQGEFTWEGGTALADVFEAELALNVPKGLCQVSDLSSATRVWANGFLLPATAEWVFSQGTFALLAEFADGRLASQTVSCQKRGALTLAWRPWDSLHSPMPLFLLVSEGRWETAVIKKGLGTSAKLMRYRAQTGLEPLVEEEGLKPEPVAPVSLRMEVLPPAPLALAPAPEPPVSEESDGPKWYNDWKVWSLLGGAALAGTYLLVKDSSSGTPAGAITFK